MITHLQKLAIGGIFLLLAATSASAQTSAAKRTAFEVAVIKPSSLQPAGPNAFAGMKVTAKQLTIGQIPLGKLIEIAYGVESQVEGPDWLRNPADAGGFDIMATLPEGATPAQVPVMLQTLLEDRFKLTMHKTSKATNTYALIVGKDGPKFLKKEAGPESDGFSRMDIAVAPSGASMGGAKISQDAGGMLIEAANPGGLTFFLTSFLRLPVVDKTGLQGTFDLKLRIDRADSRISAPITGEQRIQLQEDFEQQQKDAVAAALGKIGLKLEPQKSQVETIVIDHLEKTPTEN